MDLLKYTQQGIRIAMSTTMLAAVALPLTTVEPANAAGYCRGYRYDGTSPLGLSVQRTLSNSNNFFGRTVQLRYNRARRTAWGRILYGKPGDSVWVDRRFVGNSNWDGPCGETKIRTGTSTFTPMYNDAGLEMRACARTIESSSIIACTGWYR